MIFEMLHVFHVTRVSVRPCPVKAYIVWRIEKSRAGSGDKLIAEAQGPGYQTEDKPIDTFLIIANMAVAVS